MTTSPEKESYLDFLRSKIPTAQQSGFEPLSPPHPSLRGHQVDICQWAVRGGRRMVAANFGLGKTRINLQLGQWITEKTGGKYLIIAPLGVRQEFTRSDGPAMGITVQFIRTTAEALASDGRVFITNYESVRDGKLDPNIFQGVGMDEADVLRSFGSKTYQTFLPLFREVPYRFVFTATPSPNRYKELIHYGGFLGVMDTGEALTRFFQRDSSQAGNLTLYPHMEAQFWHWLASWAAFIQRPSDLGHSDEGYTLPEMEVHWHRLEIDHTAAWQQADSWGQHQMFIDNATGLKESAETKRDSITLRIDQARRIISRHPYEAPPAADLRTRLIDAALHFVEQQDVLRRLKEGQPWPQAFGIGGATHPTYWDGHSKGITAKTDEGETLTISVKEIQARAAQYQPVHWIIWHDLEAERHAISKAFPTAKTVYGSQDLETREDLIMGFSDGQFPILATKPILSGAGCNFQRHCHRALFLGVGYKFRDFIQAVHRIHRFQQTRTVEIHIVHLDSEDSIVADLKRKWNLHATLQARMSELIQKNNLSNPNTPPDMELTRTLTTGGDRHEAASATFRAIRNDCTLEILDWPENSVDMILTSIPFGNQYEYSPSFNDFGHNPDNRAFFEQMDHLCPPLLKILRPGRIAAIHVKDRIRFGNVTGDAFPTVDPFSDMTTAAFTKAGFRLLARITVDTDVVRENNQTYRLGWSENAKDSSKMGAGMPEYILVFRKLPTDLSNGYADTPVTKPKDEYTRADWQIDAAGLWRSNGNRLPDPETMRHMTAESLRKLWEKHSLAGGYSYDEHVATCRALEAVGKLPASFMLFPPVSRKADVWTDIARMKTLNTQQAKRKQENHVCPLQLDIIARLIRRYTNKGEIVFDPFGGIGSTPYQAIRMGRIGHMTELNLDYWKNALAYLEAAEAETQVPTLFDLAETLTPEPSAA